MRTIIIVRDTKILCQIKKFVILTFNSSFQVVDKYVVVEGTHDEKQDEHGWISRKFVRRYLIPEQCNVEKVESNLSSDGVLTISVPRKEQPKPEGAERVISIQHTGKPAIREKKPDAEEKKVEQK